ncbi:MAG: hypothetical protein EBT07_09040 [Actinobacteria bacterium]|nr:hypothetical protein [Actinomycetota bacterium]
MAYQRLFRFTPPPIFSTFGGRVFYLLAVFLLGISNPVRAQTGSGAAVSSQTRQDMQLRQQVQETDPSKSQNLEEESVTAKPLSADLGEVGIMSKPTEKPWFYTTVDCQAFYNSNVLYAESGGQKFSAWQIITSPEIGFAPQIQDEQCAMFFPRAGFRYQFFTYATAEPGSPGPNGDPGYNQTGISQNNFTVMDPFVSLGWAFTEDLFISFSADANIFMGSGRDQSLSQYVNFLDEYPLAWTASWFHSLADWNSVSITGRASYVIANPSNFTRTDNNMTFSWSTNPTKEISTQIFASYRLAKYTGLQPGTAEDTPPEEKKFNNEDRLDFQQTYGASLTWTPIEYVSLRGFVSWTKSDSSVNVAETGDYEAYNAGTGINLIYKF